MKKIFFTLVSISLLSLGESKAQETITKSDELGLRITGISYFLDVNELITLEYERILNEKSSIGISLGVTFAHSDTRGYEEFETEEVKNDKVGFDDPNKFDFVLQPYYRYFINPKKNVASRLFIEGNLFLGYYIPMKLEIIIQKHLHMLF